MGPNRMHRSLFCRFGGPARQMKPACASDPTRRRRADYLPPRAIDLPEPDHRPRWADHLPRER